ncbi:SET domain-containing protein-lysine N-methyltransferase [Maricaulis salignorans]|uniref:SET domain-containing protein n=1 Tax=Maricaulis salignorans TaxID=144026 RepID=A0A1G9PXI1_9PROT|nr:SET domain-containing protein-lysine N-methyltransferase [Maricaulis salignorans]SDM03454.1 SET domain-containing protein [Maricaulis salignorans]
MRVGEFLASYPGDSGRVFEWIELRRQGDVWMGQVTGLGAGGVTTHLRSRSGNEDGFIAELGAVGAATAILDLRVIERGEGELVLSGRRVGLGDAAGAPAAFMAEYDARVAIQTSAIHGHGVFAQRDLAAGDVITVIRGEMTSVQTPHSARITDDVHCEPTGYLRYINHCCEANSVIDAADPARPLLRARQAIRAGSEVNFDYIENEGEIVGGFACNCGATTHHI